jgi:hypothetical protein
LKKFADQVIWLTVDGVSDMMLQWDLEPLLERLQIKEEKEIKAMVAKIRENHNKWYEIASTRRANSAR